MKKEEKQEKKKDFFRTIFVHNKFSPCSAKRRASDKDLPVIGLLKKAQLMISFFLSESVFTFGS